MQISEVPIRQLLSMDMIIIEIIQAISGTMGIILTVPLTAFITVRMINQKSKTKYNKTTVKKLPIVKISA